MTTPEKKDVSIEDRSKIYVLAIQIIFGVIIGVSLINYSVELVPIAFSFEQAMVLIAFSTVMVSLIGYSITIKARPHRNFLRFVIDLILLYFYFQLIYSPLQSFEYFLLWFPLIFGLYVLWQYLEAKEYKSISAKNFRFSIGIFVGFVLIYVAYYFHPNKIQNLSIEVSKLDYGQAGMIEGGILGLVIFLVILYRLLYYLIEKI